MNKHRELKIGKKYGRLTIISYSGNSDWLCLCDCGSKKEIKYSSIKNGDTKSCGCYRREKTIANHTTHGMKNTDFYKVWMSIKDRCNRPRMDNYKYYGGRGIKMCDRWDKFENFRDDMYQSYLKHKKNNVNTRLDRINNNGNYCKKNCQWLTHKENCNKTRQCHYINYNGLTKTISEWSDYYGIGYDKLERRLNKSKWSIKKSLNKK